MGTITGKAFFFCIMHCIVLNAGIQLTLHNADGIATDTVIVGQPFTIDATITEVNGSVQAPTIEGVDKFFAKRTGMYMSTINGVSTTKYSYQARIDQPGSYRIGPARVMHQQKELVSNVLSVTVVHDNHAHVAKEKGKTQAEPKAFLRLAVDADHAVVGQKIEASLRFYYQDSTISLSHIGQPEIIGFNSSAMSKPVGFSEDINGTHYRCAEWKWQMYPKIAGELVIPAYNADFEIPLQDNRFLGSFFMFVNNRADRKRVYSNAVKVVVDPLPYHAGTVDAVGSFESITTTITPPVAKEGEGMVLSLEITGNGNMNTIKTPILSLPSEFNYYDSNVTMDESPHEEANTKKRFEFIVQGTKAGDWEIPAQSFVYFDIKKHAYVTLHSSPLSVSIQSLGNKESRNHVLPTSSKLNENDVCSSDQNEDMIGPLNVKGPWYPVSDREPVSWFIFHFLWSLPFVFIGYPRLRNLSSRFMNNSGYWFKKRVYKNARKKVNLYDTTGNAKGLYSVFIELFAALHTWPLSCVSPVVIDEWMNQSGFSEEKRKEWHVFFERIAHAAYAQSTENNTHELCRMAIQWIDVLEKNI